MCGSGSRERWGTIICIPSSTLLSPSWALELVLSPPTSAQLLERMEVCPTDEPCLAVKLHFSHADLLAQRENVDLLLLPIIARVKRASCCPKFIGIADMLRHGLRLPDERVMMPVVEFTDDDRRMARALRPLAERLGVADRATLRRAIRAARGAQQAFRRICINYRCTTPEAFRALEQGGVPEPVPAGDGPTVAVIGHAYLLYEMVSQGMIDRLRGCARVLTAEMVEDAAIDLAVSTIPEGERMWPFEAMLLGAALHLLRSRAVDKMILVGSFECGPESIIEAYIEEEAQRQGIPLMVLTLDEHSGEAGLVTRLEAFMDTEKAPTTALAPPPAFHVAGREEMVVGFPSMGHLDIAIRNFLQQFGVKTLPTPRSRRCVELGREIAPEFVCFPFTATLGQLRELLDQGANTLVMVGGKGYCRLGWYAQVQERLLRSLGYDFEMIIVDAPTPVNEKWPRFHTMLKRLTGGAPWPRILGALYTAYQQLAALDRAETLAHRLRAFERVQGTTDRLLDRYLRRLSVADELHAIKRLERDFLREITTIDTEDTAPLRVRIVGEIWVVLEQSATRDVERWLGARTRPRVWIERDLSATNWFQSHVLKVGHAVQREHDVFNAAAPWLAQSVGGHGQFTVGQVALAPREGIDGVLHIFPFTCMPEIIAQNIIVRISEELDIPVLTYIVSEQTGEAGMETRLESFLDLLDERRMAGSATTAAAGFDAMSTPPKRQACKECFCVSYVTCVVMIQC